MYGTSAYGRVAYGAKPSSDAPTTFPEPVPGIGKILLLGVGSYLLMLLLPTYAY